MAAVSINRILSTQDRIVLDQEYTAVMNNLNLGNIRPDSDIMELYRRILDTISRERLRSEESEFLQAKYDSEMKGTISQAISGAGAAIAVNGGTSLMTGNVFGVLGGIADGVMSGYFIYQNNSSVREDIDRDLWRLKNEIQKQLLTSSWNLLNQYKLPDSARLVENAIKESGSREILRSAGSALASIPTPFAQHCAHKRRGLSVKFGVIALIRRGVLARLYPVEL